jgi:hypothetical protein
VSVIRGRQSGADVQELAVAFSAGQVMDRAAGESAISAGLDHDDRQHLGHLVASLAVGSVIVRAA